MFLVIYNLLYNCVFYSQNFKFYEKKYYLPMKN
jgi:hypothetical protein